MRLCLNATFELVSLKNRPGTGVLRISDTDEPTDYFAFTVDAHSLRELSLQILECATRLDPVEVDDGDNSSTDL